MRTAVQSTGVERRPRFLREKGGGQTVPLFFVTLTDKPSGCAIPTARLRRGRLSVLGSLLYALLLGGAGEVLAQSTCTTSSPAITEYKTAQALADDVDLADLATDCTTLLGLGGAQGFNRLPLDWSTGTNIETWTGVTVAETPPRVTELHIVSDRVGGSIPDLRALTQLKELELYKAELTGPIPTTLSNFTQLTRLELFGNELTGPIPTTLSSLTQLKYLELHNNDLDGSIPATLSSLDQLRHLELHNNDLSGPIPDLSNLAQLTWLNLHNNDLSGPIPDLSNLDQLTRLDLSHTALKGDLPAGLRAQEPETLLWTIDSPLSGDCKLRRVWTSTQDTDASAALQAWPTQSSPAGSLFDITVENAQGPGTECYGEDAPIQLRLPIPTDMTASQAALYRYNEDVVPPAWERQTAGAGRDLTGQHAYEYEVYADITAFSLFRVGQDAPQSGGGNGGDGGGGNGGGGNGGGGNGGGGGGGGGRACARDVHGNTSARATEVALGSTTAGAICPASDRDYFSVSAPGPGFLSVATDGQVRTRGVIRQHGEVLASGPTSGGGPDGGLDAQVEAGPVVVLIRGDRGGTGAYHVTVRLTPAAATGGLTGVSENPGHHSFQSGIGVLSGWVCEAESVELEIGTLPRQKAAYGTERLDTLEVCGDTDNGFGLLVNWNLLGDGPHAVVAFVDGAEWTRATVQVTTLGEEFLRGAEESCEVADFPSPDEQVSVLWQESLQNFVIAGGQAPDGPNRVGSIDMGFLENPGSDSFQSGIGIISGWVCEADEVWVQMGDFEPQPAAYGTERLDTLEVCGDTDNGFGLLFNWNLLGDGPHAVVAFVDGVEWARATVQVTTLGEEFVRDAEGSCEVADFPEAGETVTLTWQQRLQNFVIADRE